MDIRDKSILILGAYGLVGQAVARRLLREAPCRMILLSLRREEAEEVAASLAGERGNTVLDTAWGDVFGFTDTKDLSRREVLADPRQRERLIETMLEPLSEARASEHYLYDLVARERPDAIVDTLSTAAGIAYQDIYKAARVADRTAKKGMPLDETLERILVGDYVPQLIRHVQVLHRAMLAGGTGAYVKVGTTGTGGMGLNLPYTHSEDRPSRLLLAKSALAGAQTQLLFLMGRTPGGPIVKEVKPAAAIAWKQIGFGEIRRAGKALPLYDADPAAAEPLRPGERFRPVDSKRGRDTGATLKSVFIDTGENGIFSLEEFSAISSGDQMELVTPEEVADIVALELRGANTGHDVVAAMDRAVFGPSYRAGLLRHRALERLAELETAHGVRSVAFESLGPPRLGKLLHEAELLRRAYGTMSAVRATETRELSRRLEQEIDDPSIRQPILSIGIPILLPDARLVRGPLCKIPVVTCDADALEVTAEGLEAWAHSGWVDLREANMALWKRRFGRIQAESDALPAADTSSRFIRDRQFWDGVIRPGKLAAWIFDSEEGGARMK